MAYTSVKISANSSDYQSQMKSAAAQMKVRFGNRQPKGKSRIAHSKNHGAERHCAVK